MGRPRVFVVPGSPPCACIEAALRLKGVGYDVTELPNLLHIPHQLVRFRDVHVPAMVLDGEKVTGSRSICARIDARWPGPPRLYAGGDAVREAERWGDEVLQSEGRRISLWGLRHAPADAARTFLDGNRLPMPDALARLVAPAVVRAGGLRNQAFDRTVQADVERLPAHLDRIEAWIADGVLGDEAEPNAADLQIGATLALLSRFADLAAVIDRRPGAAALARRLFPRYPGHVPAGSFPAAWLEAAAAV